MYYILDKDGNYITKYKTTIEAADYFGCTKENIRQCVQTGRPVLKSSYYVKEKE